MVSRVVLQRKEEKDREAGRNSGDGHEPEDPTPCCPFDDGATDEGPAAVGEGNDGADDAYL